MLTVKWECIRKEVIEKTRHAPIDGATTATFVTMVPIVWI